MHLPFWLTTAALSPLLFYQGRQARQEAPRLPEACGEPFGQWGSGTPIFRVLVVGESTAAGVGVQSHDQGLASQLARLLHEQSKKTIAWNTHGINGAKLTELRDALKGKTLPRADMVLLSMGVNDTTGLTPRNRFRQELLNIGEDLRALHHGPLQLLSVPPMHQFTALPSPLRQIMGWRARQLNSVYQQLAGTSPREFSHLRYPPVSDTSLLASDGYHPGPAGYRAMAEALAEALLPILTDPDINRCP